MHLNTDSARLALLIVYLTCSMQSCNALPSQGLSSCTLGMKTHIFESTRRSGGFIRSSCFKCGCTLLSNEQPLFRCRRCTMVVCDRCCFNGQQFAIQEGIVGPPDVISMVKVISAALLGFSLPFYFGGYRNVQRYNPKRIIQADESGWKSTSGCKEILFGTTFGTMLHGLVAMTKPHMGSCCGFIDVVLWVHVSGLYSILASLAVPYSPFGFILSQILEILPDELSDPAFSTFVNKARRLMSTKRREESLLELIMLGVMLALFRLLMSWNSSSAFLLGAGVCIFQWSKTNRVNLAQSSLVLMFLVLPLFFSLLGQLECTTGLFIAVILHTWWSDPVELTPKTMLPALCNVFPLGSCDFFRKIGHWPINILAAIGIALLGVVIAFDPNPTGCRACVIPEPTALERMWNRMVLEESRGRRRWEEWKNGLAESARACRQHALRA